MYEKAEIGLGMWHVGSRYGSKAASAISHQSPATLTVPALKHIHLTTIKPLRGYFFGLSLVNTRYHSS